MNSKLYKKLFKKRLKTALRMHNAKEKIEKKKIMQNQT